MRWMNRRERQDQLELKTRIHLRHDSEEERPWRIYQKDNHLKMQQYDQI
jgi:3-methyladenine DNA glycosylase Mpg